MKKSEIVVGGKYKARISGNFVTVEVLAIREISKFFRTNYRGESEYRYATVYDVLNLKTGRKTTFQSATKFRGPALPEKASTQKLFKWMLSSMYISSLKNYLSEFRDPTAVRLRISYCGD